jgi:primase-polymerase (primpol)-like protein
MLPLEQVSTEGYFKEPMAKIALWGSTSEDAEIQAAVSEAQQLQKSSKENEESNTEKEKASNHQAVTIKLQGADENIGNAIKKFLRPVEEVQKSMMEKVELNGFFVTKTFSSY